MAAFISNPLEGITSGFFDPLNRELEQASGLISGGLSTLGRESVHILGEVGQQAATEAGRFAGTLSGEVGQLIGPVGDFVESLFRISPISY